MHLRLLGPAAAVALLAACGSPAAPAGAPAAPVPLTLYSAQHQEIAQAWVDEFTEQTGIPVTIRRGGDFELANQIVAEGDSSPADVFITENTPALSLLSSKGRLAPLDDATTTQVPAQYRSGAGDWIGVAARSTVLVYNPTLVRPDQLPASIMDLALPPWKDAVGVAAGGADFQAIVSAVYAVEGDQKAGEWLEGLKTNAHVYQNNVAIMKAVNAGDIPAGVIYHYYWYKDQAEGGAGSSNTRLEFFGNKDAGAFLSVSGAGVVNTTKNAAEAQQLVAFMSGTRGQEILASTDALEYTIGDGVPANAKLKPFAELDPPTVDLNTLNGPKVITEMQRVGFL